MGLKEEGNFVSTFYLKINEVLFPADSINALMSSEDKYESKKLNSFLMASKLRKEEAYSILCDIGFLSDIKLELLITKKPFVVLKRENFLA